MAALLLEGVVMGGAMEAKSSYHPTLTLVMGVGHFQRPKKVELKEYVKIGQCVYEINVDKEYSINFNPIRSVNESPSSNEDVDQLSTLVLEVIPSSSCLIFCPTKKNCENVACMLTHCLPRSLRNIKMNERKQLLKMLSIEAAGVCPVLAESIPWGIAYHHSGLTADERRVIEEAYLSGVLYLIACTSTLAAGVNLPASRVILRSPHVGQQFVTRSQYKQMVGRAGRTGLCNVGESIVILKPWEKDKMVDLLTSSYDSCTSSLLCDNGRVLVSLILSVIALKLVDDDKQLSLFLKNTLANQQHKQKGGEEVLTPSIHLMSIDAVAKLISLGYITTKPHPLGAGSLYAVTNMGKAVHKGCLDVGVASTVYCELISSLNSLVLSCDLHLLFLATPSDLVGTIEPNWSVFFEKVISLPPAEQKVIDVLKVNNGLLSKKAVGTARRLSPEEKVRYCRIYLALLLHQLLKEPNTSQGVWKIADTFHCSRGFVQNVLHQSSSYVSCLVHFTEEIPELWPLKLLLPTLGQRLSYAVSVEAVPLMEVPGIKQGRAKQLLSVGVKTPQDLAKADPLDLCRQVEHLYPKQARKLVAAAKMLLAEKVDALHDEAEELLTLLSPAAPFLQPLP